MVTHRQSTGIRQKQIVAAAARLTVKYGSEHLTVRRLAKEIGVSEGAIYRHFKSKAEILSFLVDDIEQTLLDDLKSNPEASNSALGRLEQAIIHMQQRKDVTFLIIAEIMSLGDKKLNRKITGVVNEYIAAIREVLADATKTGIIKEDVELDAAAMLFFGMVQGVVNLWALSGYNFDLKERYRYVWQVFRQAVLKPSD